MHKLTLPDRSYAQAVQSYEQVMHRVMHRLAAFSTKNLGYWDKLRGQL